MNIWTRKDKPLLVLAPMAGYTDSAFRQLCREYGADIMMTELVSADAIAFGKFKVAHLCHPRLDRGSTKEDSHLRVTIVERKNSNTAGLLNFSESERPLVVQLFGKYPEKFAKAAKWISEELRPDGIDINMGCPARKVVGSDHGAALLKNCGLAVEIVKAVKENTDLPVSVKTRLGWQDDDEVLEFAPLLMEAGIDAIIVHGRTYKDGFKGKARWENIYKLKSKIKTQNSKCSVIGNGDIQSYQQALARADGREVKLDGVAIGRAVFGQPWIFQAKNENPNAKIKEVIIRHAALAYQSKGDHGIVEFRKHLLAYLKGFPGAKEMRMKAVNICTVNDIKEIVDELYERG